MSPVIRSTSMSSPLMNSPPSRTLLSPLLRWSKLNSKESPKLCRRGAALSTPPGKTGSRSVTSPVWRRNRRSQKLELNFSSWGYPNPRPKRWGPARSPQGRSNPKWRTLPRTSRSKPGRTTPASASEQLWFFLSFEYPILSPSQPLQPRY